MTTSQTDPIPQQHDAHIQARLKHFFHTSALGMPSRSFLALDPKTRDVLEECFYDDNVKFEARSLEI